MAILKIKNKTTGQWEELEALKGDKGDTGNTGSQGPKGDAGNDGLSPIITTSKTGKQTTITIVDAEGTKTATILDGADGTGAGDMTKAVYDVNDNGIVDKATADKDGNQIDTTYAKIFRLTLGNTYTYQELSQKKSEGYELRLSAYGAEYIVCEFTNSEIIFVAIIPDDEDGDGIHFYIYEFNNNTWNTRWNYLPTELSDLTNDTGFITNSVNNLTNYYTKTYIDDLVGDIESILEELDIGGGV